MLLQLRSFSTKCSTIIYDHASSCNRKQWIQRHLSDPFVKQAAAENYRSRGAFKLQQILEMGLVTFKPGQTVIDLGAAPGGWSQVAAGRVGPSGKVLAIDRLPMEPIKGVDFIQGDFENVAKDLKIVGAHHIIS
jgi:23S rRNA (uridine2552-2'-O)-methyltransferase